MRILCVNAHVIRRCAYYTCIMRILRILRVLCVLCVICVLRVLCAYSTHIRVLCVYTHICVYACPYACPLAKTQAPEGPGGARHPQPLPYYKVIVLLPSKNPGPRGPRRGATPTAPTLLQGYRTTPYKDPTSTTRRP